MIINLFMGGNNILSLNQHRSAWISDETLFRVFDIASQGIYLILLREIQSKTSSKFNDNYIGSHNQTSFTVVISFVFSSWIINEFETNIYITTIVIIFINIIIITIVIIVLCVSFSQDQFFLKQV